MPDEILVTSPSALALPRGTDQHPVAVYLSSLAAGSRRTMRQSLQVVAGWLSDGQMDELTFPWHVVRYQHAQAVRAMLSERYAPATANKMLMAMRRVLRECERLGLMSAEEYRRATDIKTVHGKRVGAAAGRALASGEIKGLMEACAIDTSIAGARDGAIIGLAYGCGLRRAELAALDVRHVDLTGKLLTVHGKRNSQRAVPIAAGALEALEDWLFGRGATPGPLFVRIRRGGHLGSERLTDAAIYHILALRADQAGVARFSPHDIRRTYAGDLMDAGVDMSTVQAMMGHSSVDTTARYDRRGERAKRAAAQTLHVPYIRRPRDKQ